MIGNPKTAGLNQRPRRLLVLLRVTCGRPGRMLERQIAQESLDRVAIIAVVA